MQRFSHHETAAFVAAASEATFFGRNERAEAANTLKSDVQTERLVGSNPNNQPAIVTFEQICSPRYVSPTPFFLELKCQDRGKTYFIKTVENFIRICGKECKNLKSSLETSTLLKHHYLSQGGEIEKTFRSVLDGEPVDLSEIKTPAMAAFSVPTEEEYSPVQRLTAAMKGQQTESTSIRPVMITGGRDVDNYIRGAAEASVVQIAPLSKQVPQLPKFRVPFPSSSVETPMFGKGGKRKANVELLIAKGEGKLMLTGRFVKSRQTVSLLLSSNTRRFVEKCKNTEQWLFNTPDEVFYIEQLLRKASNPYLRRLFVQTFPKYTLHPFQSEAYLFWYSTAYSTMKGNYGPQIKQFVDYVNFVSSYKFPSVSHFVQFLRTEKNRRSMASYVTAFFQIRASTRSSDSVANWWSGINKCYLVWGRKLSYYVSADIKKSIKNGYFSESHETDGLYAKEWVIFIHWCYSKSLKYKLAGLFMCYMMRMGMRAGTLALLHFQGPMLVHDPKLKLWSIHQWGLTAKNCKRPLGDLPTFRMIKEEPPSRVKPFLCAVWALQQICMLRKSLKVDHDCFLFSETGDTFSPSQWRNVITTFLREWQSTVAKSWPLVQALKLGGHTPRKTFANIAEFYNLSSPEIKMMMASSMSSIKSHYLEKSRAYNSSDSWTKLLNCFQLKTSSHKPLLKGLTKPLVKQSRITLDEFDVLSLYD